MNMKFAFGDYIALKIYENFGGEYGQILRFDESKQMYIVILFLDKLGPLDFYRWSYVKEEDMVKTDIYDSYSKQPLFNRDVDLNACGYHETYNSTYFIVKRFHDGEITLEECYKLIDSNKEQHLLDSIDELFVDID